MLAAKKKSHCCIYAMLLEKITLDERLTVWHTCLFLALLYLWKKANYTTPFSISRRKLMQLAHIRAIATYHKCLKDLVAFGYLRYQPSYHPSWGSSVSINFEPI